MSPAQNPTRAACVAIPAFRRPDLLKRLLGGIALQIGTSTPTDVRVVIFDNDPDGSAHRVVEDCRPGFPFVLEYRAVPEPGLACVRNAILAYCADRFDVVAMIDDDERPEPRWLAELLTVHSECRADAVVGPVPQRLPDGAPEWIRRGRFFAMPDWPDRSLRDDGHSGNCLLDLHSVRRFAMQFDAACNFAGGEDQLFFRQLHARGGRIVYAARADAPESVLPERLCARYLLRRALRRGNSLWICDAKIHGTARVMAIRVAKGAVRLALGIALLPLRALASGRAGVLHSLCDAARGVGTLAGVFGIVILEYRRKGTPDANRALIETLRSGHAKAL